MSYINFFSCMIVMCKAVREDGKEKEQYGILSLLFIPEDSSSNNERKVIVHRVKWHYLLSRLILRSGQYQLTGLKVMIKGDLVMCHNLSYK